MSGSTSESFHGTIINWGSAYFIPDETGNGLIPVAIIDGVPLDERNYETWEQNKWLALQREPSPTVQVICRCALFFEVPMLDLEATLAEYSLAEGQTEIET